jgi:hypothetical protein
MVSLPAKWIDDVIRFGPAPLLKRHGYKKNRRRFVKENPESSSIIEFQASQWNTDTATRFTINILSHFPSLEFLTDDKSPRKALTRSLSSLGARIGHLMPEKQDHWWIISPESDRTEIGSEVSYMIENFALPWLERTSTVQGLAEHGRHLPLPGHFPCLVAASALAVLGKQSEAMALFNEYQSGLKGPGRCERAWLRKYAGQA